MTQLVVQKRVTNAVLYENGMIRLENIRFSYPHIDKAHAHNGKGEAKFSVVSMLPKETHEAAKNLIRDEMNRLLAEKKMKVKSDMKCLKDGDKAASEDDDADAETSTYANHWVVSSRESNRPTARRKDGTKLDPVDDIDEIKALFYGGAYGHVMIRLWLQDNDFGQRVNAGLVTIMFSKDGEPFGQGRVDDSDAWGDVADADGGKKGSKVDEDDDL